jgi:hypothetical protein
MQCLCSSLCSFRAKGALGSQCFTRRGYAICGWAVAVRVSAVYAIGIRVVEFHIRVAWAKYTLHAVHYFLRR